MTRPSAVLLDTCALIWFAERALSPPIIDALEHAAMADGVFVSPVSAWEIGFLTNPRGNRPIMQLLPDPQSWFANVMARREIRQAPLTPAAALGASYLPEPIHGDPADRLLIATAREMKAAIATSDRKILDYAALGHVQALAC